MQELQSFSHESSRRDPSPMSCVLAGILAGAVSRLGADGAVALSRGARLGLEARQRELAPCLAGAAPGTIKLILATLDGMPTRTETDPERARFALEIAVTDLSGIPEFALAYAARAFRKGIAGDGKWRPTTGELARIARHRAEPFQTELARINRVLGASAPPPAPLIDDARRAELSAKVCAAAAEMAANARMADLRRYPAAAAGEARPDLLANADVRFACSKEERAAIIARSEENLARLAALPPVRVRPATLLAAGFDIDQEAIQDSSDS